ncbi:BlaI/MecI/CopY family transcriptional regulator [Blautia difficilis]|mgnify:FL=1|uniref:BlaI/MecI/CopY family transcriptional regulator n=1 Tax=Blautia difficilis TaxID=2763027 RepID=A0ABR7IH44_9FIRM|nr:BlaI/MecI/CopY family transcriptional regulator [Blautia difficilis]MBC5779351.1 BlaI/MecI/CopY family transcriptional regulator [Blautia difficilis]
MVHNAMSATEFYILKYLWSRETPATFSEIMTHFNEEEKKEWKKQTVNTFLTRLAQKGFLNIDKSGKRAIYIPSVSKKKYYEDYAQQIIEDSYEGSLKNFICAFTENHKLTSNEKEELLTYVRSL